MQVLTGFMASARDLGIDVSETFVSMCILFTVHGRLLMLTKRLPLSVQISHAPCHRCARNSGDVHSAAHI